MTSLNFVIVSTLIFVLEIGVKGQGEVALPSSAYKYRDATIQECPALCRCLEKGSILTCEKMGLHHIPALLSTTMFLDLDHNQISFIQNNSFLNVPRLEILSLEDNRIMYINSEAFSHLPELRILRLGSNHLSSFPRDLFQNNRYLQVLELSGNMFTAIPHQAMTHLHNLEKLNMSYNRLESPRLGLGFRYTTRMTSLDLTGNNFPSLEANAFQVVQLWDDNTHSVNLSFCGIQHIHPETFRQILNIESLSLAGNLDLPHAELQSALRELQTSNLQILNLSWLNLTDVHEFFRTFQHKNLLELYLSHNQIDMIQRETFYFLVELRTLDLSHNKIVNIEDITSLSQLQDLNLAYNRLRSLDSMAFESLHNLHHLDLSHNFLSHLDDAPFQDLFNLQILDISWNQVSDVDISGGFESLDTLLARHNLIRNVEFLQGLRTLHVLDLSHNVLNQLRANSFAKGQPFQLLNLSSNAIFNIHPKAFRDSQHGTLDLSYNRLTSLADMGLRSVRRLILSHNKLYNVTASALRTVTDLEELHLDNNDLYAFPQGFLSRLPQLRFLDLGSNPLGAFLLIADIAQVVNTQAMRNLMILRLAHTNLQKFPDQLLANLTTLQVLDLSGNLINTFSGAWSLNTLQRLQRLYLSSNRIQYPDTGILKSLQSLHVVDLSHNPFDCTCDFMPFRTWAVASLSSNSHVRVQNIHNSTYYQCSSPTEWKGVALLNFHLDSSTCSTQEKAVIFTAVGCVTLALGLTLTIAILRYKWWQRRKMAMDTQYTFIDESSTSAFNGSNGSSIQMNSQCQKQKAAGKEWV